VGKGAGRTLDLSKETAQRRAHRVFVPAKE
jgi:hypothetical protein